MTEALALTFLLFLFVLLFVLKRSMTPRRQGEQVVRHPDPLAPERFRAIARAVIIGIGIFLMLVTVVQLVSKFERWVTSGPSAPQVQVVAAPSRFYPCTAERPCTPELLSDGSTKMILIPPRTNVCFESRFWADLPRLNYMMSGNGKEERYECTQEDVMKGQCPRREADAFRFVPEPGVHPPQYWFVPGNINVCG